MVDNDTLSSSDDGDNERGQYIPWGEVEVQPLASTSSTKLVSSTTKLASSQTKSSSSTKPPSSKGKLTSTGEVQMLSASQGMCYLTVVASILIARNASPAHRDSSERQ